MGTSSAVETLNRRPPHHRLSFAWWWWLVIGLVVLLAAGSLFVVTHVSRRQAAVVEINRLGWFGETRPGEPDWLRDNLPNSWYVWFDDQTTVVLDRSGVTDATLTHVGQFATLERVWVKRAAITDAGLGHLAGLTNLTDLALMGANITDAGLLELSELNNLKDLSLDYTRITDAGLVSLTSLKGLESLGLNGTEVSDAGVGHLLSLPKLRYLAIEQTRITEQGIARLRGLPALRILSLDSTQISDGLQQQLDAFPSLETLRINNRQVVDLSERRPDLFAEIQSIADLGVLLNSEGKRRRHFEEHGDRIREDDGQLCLILQEIVARGGNEAEQLLLSKLGRLDLGEEAEFKYEYHGSQHDNELDYLTALRRLQRQPDPLSMSVDLPRNLKANTRSLPKLTVMIRSLDGERLTLLTRKEFDLKDPKWASTWRIEVRDSSGELLPDRSHQWGTSDPGAAGRIGWFHFGEFAYAQLPMDEYIELPDAGEYTVTIVYRPRGFPRGTAEIDEPEDARSLITFRSVPFKLKVDPAPDEPPEPSTEPDR